MPARPRIVIVGAGHGGFNAASALRQRGFDGRIFLIDRQAGLPYQRPPLSKGFISSGDPSETLAFRPETFFATHEIELIENEATDIDRSGRIVHLTNGHGVAYDHLILAQGAKARHLDVDGAKIDGIFVLRVTADAERLRAGLGDAQTVVVIGAGFIGLEVAATAASLGKRVTVVELAERVMGRTATPTLAEYVLRHHRSHGIRFVMGARVSRVEGKGGRVAGIALADGTRLPADLVLAGLGVAADDELALKAGLAVDDGILVDATLRTDDPAISAIGDVARFPERETGKTVRLESVQNAVDQAKCVAARLTGDLQPYGATPWFWSDQGNLRLQMAGLSSGIGQTLTVGETTSGRFSILCFRDRQLVAVESVNRPADHIAARQIFDARRAPAMRDIEGADFNLKDYAKSLRASP